MLDRWGSCKKLGRRLKLYLEYLNNYPAWARKKIDITKLGIEPPPFEYLRLQLCRDVYHCTPSQLDREDWREIAVHIELMSVEAEINEAKNRNG